MDLQSHKIVFSHKNRRSCFAKFPVSIYTLVFLLFAFCGESDKSSFNDNNDHIDAAHLYEDGTIGNDSSGQNENQTDGNDDDNKDADVANSCSEIVIEDIMEVHSAWCEIAQGIAASVDMGIVEGDGVTVENIIHDDQGEFVNAKPGIDKSKKELTIHSYDTTSPSCLFPLDCQIWCKMKKQNPLADAFGEAIVIGEAKSCAEVNQYALEWVLENVSNDCLQKFLDSEINISFEDDVVYARGDQWVDSQLTIEIENDKDYFITSTSLVSEDWIPLVGGNLYCKLLAPSAILVILRDILLEP